MYNGVLPPGTEKPLVAVIGPTGSGKSDLALSIAEEFHGEILNCDSLQIYRHFDIGTAKLPLLERRGIPHHLLDILEPNQVFTAGEFARRAAAVLADISARNHLPVVAGGTGFYLRALLDGLFPGPQRDEALRGRLAEREARHPGALHKLLRRFDREAAARVHPNDIPKLIRALEVCLLTRRPLTRLFQEGRAALVGYRTIKLGISPDRTELYEKLDARCEQMFRSGLVEEVQRILDMGFAADVKPFESHGYRQVVQMLRGELTAKEALFYAQRNTRRYAKRQVTWFRQEKDVHWLRGFGGEPDVKRRALELVRDLLTSV